MYCCNGAARSFWVVFLTTSISVFAAPYMTKKVTLAATAMHLHSEGLVAR